jgi:PAS domain S-box-containing protein
MSKGGFRLLVVGSEADRRRLFVDALNAMLPGRRVKHVPPNRIGSVGHIPRVGILLATSEDEVENLCALFSDTFPDAAVFVVASHRSVFLGKPPSRVGKVRYVRWDDNSPPFEQLARLIDGLSCNSHSRSDTRSYKTPDRVTSYVAFGLRRSSTEHTRIDGEAQVDTEEDQGKAGLFSSGPMVVFRWRNEEGWPVEYVTPNVKNVFGYSNGEFMSGAVSYAEIIPEEDIERVALEVKTNSESGAERFEHEPYRIVRKDGKTIWIADFTTILRDESGRVTYYLGYVVDITDRKRVEEARDRERRFFRMMAHTATEVTDVGQLCQRVLVELVGEMGFNFGLIRLYDNSSRYLDAVAILDFSGGKLLDGIQPRSIDDESSLVAKSVRNRETILSSDIVNDESYRNYREKLEDTGIRAFICWPLYVTSDDLLGVIELASSFPMEVGETERGFLESVSGMFATVLERKRAESALIKSEEKYRTLSENIPVGIFRTTPEGRFLSVNPALVKMLGYGSSEELLGVSAVDLYLDAGQRKEMIGRLESECAVADVEVALRRKNGTPVWVSISSQAVSDGSNRFHIDGVVKDITERKRAQLELSENIAYLDAILRSSSEYAIVTTDMDFVPTYMNPRAEEVLGISIDRVIGTSLVDLHKKWGVETKRFYGIAEKLRDRGEYRFEFPQPNDSSRTIEAFISGVFDNEKRPIGFALFAHDVTDRQKAIEALKESEERYRSLVASMTEGIGVVDESENVIFSNDAFARIFGLNDEKEIVGRNLMEFTSSDQFELMREETKKRRTGEQSRYDAEIIRPDGEKRVVSISARPLVDQDGVFGGCIGLVSDITERRRADKALREAHRRFEALIANVPGVVYRAAVRGGCRLQSEFLSDACEELCGYPAEELLGEDGPTFADLILPEDDKRTWDEIRQALDDRESFRCKYRIKAADESLVWVYDEGRGVYNDDGAPIAIEGVMIDITDNMEATEARERLTTELRERTEQLEWNRLMLSRLLEVSSLLPATRTVDESLRVVTSALVDAGVFSKALLALIDTECVVTNVGYASDSGQDTDKLETARSVRGKAVELFEPDVSGFFHEGILRVLPDDAPRLLGWDVPIVDDQESVVAFELRESGGSPLGYLAVYYRKDQMLPSEETMEAVKLFLDLTASVVARRRIEARHTDLLSAIPDIVFRFDDDWTTRFVSDACEDVLGYKSDELLGRSFRDLWADDDEQILRGMQRTTAEGAWSGELRMKRDNGVVRHFLMSMRRSVDGGAVAVARDDEDRRQIQAQLFEVQRMESMGLLAGGVAHDFNNLLAVILGGTSLLDRMVEAADARRHLSAIEESAERAAELAAQLLAFSRRSARSGRSCDARVAVRNTAVLLKRAVSPDVELIVDLAQPVSRVGVDAGQLQQVVMNLGINASLAMPDGGTLTVACRPVDESDALKLPVVKDGEWVAIDVSDTGIGMDEETSKHVFDPFFTTRESGTGLGLSVVYGIVSSHGGHIALETSVGTGSIFTICLPVEKRGFSADLERDESVPHGTGEKVLVVDDEREVAAIAADLLESLGYRPIVAGSGREALETLVSESGIRLIIADYAMPEMNGAQLAQQARTIQPSVPVLLSSGLGIRLAEDATISSCVDGFIHKPYTVRKLARTVRQVLMRKS